MTETRKAYARPVLEELGTATAITKNGQSRPGDDALCGSGRGKGKGNDSIDQC